MDVIETLALRKRFGRATALDGVDLRVAEGEVHGFLGPNGAGKSTTIRILLGLLRPTSGSARVLGLDAWRDAVTIHRRIACVPGDVTLWPGLTGGEAIDVLLGLRGVDPARCDRDRLIEAFEFDPRKRGRSYSKGNRQKVALVAALASPADLYLLDEPTSGLDPLMEGVFRAEVERVRRAGATVLLSSHILSEVEHLCDRVSIIRAGRIVESGTLSELRHLSHTVVSYEGEAPAGFADAEVDGRRVRLSVTPERLPDLLAWAATHPVTGLTLQPPTLEELFLRYYDRGGEAVAGDGERGAVDGAAAHVRHDRAPSHALDEDVATGPDGRADAETHTPRRAW